MESTRRAKAKQGERRRTFVVSRGLEYFTDSELAMQIGTAKAGWPAAVLKELLDNAVDACELGGVRPEVAVNLTPEGFTVTDNGPGIPATTVERSLDYYVRVSDKLGYVVPTRGRLGNALKVVWAAPFVATGSSSITVRTRSARHEIEVGVDRIEQRPAIKHDVLPGDLESGTEFRVRWANSACSLNGAAPPDFYKTGPNAKELVEAFAAFNPHVTFRLNGESFPAMDPVWKKWDPAEKLVAHWYTASTFRDLAAHYVASERYGAEPITVRAFVAGFRGLTSTAKQKEVTEGFKREYLHELAVDGDLDRDGLTVLLDRMKKASRPVRPARLGVIGKDHLAGWMVERAGVTELSIQYKRRTGEQDGLPYVVEIAFGVSRDDDAVRRIVTGLNWSPTLDVPVTEIREILQEMRVDPHDPVVIAIHMARPAWNYTERGKGAVEL